MGPFLDFYDRWFNMRLDVLIGAFEALPAAKRSPLGPIVIFEAPILPSTRFDPVKKIHVPAPTNIATTRKLQGLAGMTEMICHRRKVEVREEYLQTIKKGLAGNGRADKLDMIRAAKRAGLTDPTADEADAFGVWLIGGVRNYAKPFSRRWDALLYAPAKLQA